MATHTGVQDQTPYKANSYTGQTLYKQPPSANQLAQGVTYDGVTGTYAGLPADYPAVSNVRQGTTFDNGSKTGTLDLPATTDVRVGVAFDNNQQVGSFAPLPPAALIGEELCLPPADLIDVQEAAYAG